MARKIIYLLLIVLIFLTGCKKEEEKEYTAMDVAGAIADIGTLTVEPPDFNNNSK